MEIMGAPLYEKLKQYSQSNVYPFHMPGHKMGRGVQPENLFAIDITEIDGFDNLHKPENVIDKAQKLAAKTFGADETYFLVNGSSGGIIGSILAVCGNEEGKPIIIGRNSHKSVFDGLVLSGGSPRYVMPKVYQDCSVFAEVSPEDIEIVCNENPKSGAVIIVSPTYEGIVSDIKRISEIVHRHNMILIVDEAHGAHFSLNDYFPKSAVYLGADIVIQSLHKTLPAPTQTALLHVCGSRVNKQRLRKCLAMTQTSSPSYIFMGMIDKCRDYLDNKGKSDFDIYVENLRSLRNKLGKLKNIKLLDEENVIDSVAFDYDRGKIVVYSNGINCVEIGNMLKKADIELEMCVQTHLIAMTSVSDTEDGFNRLAEALINIDKKIEENENLQNGFVFPAPKILFTPREAYFKGTKKMLLKDAVGKVSAEFVIPYPPGIPLLSPGEEITEEIMGIIRQFKECNVNVIGIDDLNIEKILVLD